MWDVGKIAWASDERNGSVHRTWREEVVATRPSVREAREITAANNVPGNGHCWEVRFNRQAAPAPVTAPAPPTRAGVLHAGTAFAMPAPRLAPGSHTDWDGKVETP